MKKLFLSYRRSDSEALTNRIHAVLEAEFGVGNVLQNVMNAVNTGASSVVALLAVIVPMLFAVVFVIQPPSIQTPVALAQATSAAAVTLTAMPTPTLSPLEVAAIPVSRNADWTPITQEFNGVTMVLVPAGRFEMGSTAAQIDAAFAMCQQAADNNATCERNWFEDELIPAQGGNNQTIRPFWLDETEVTRAHYAACVAAGQCEDTLASDYSTTDEQPINNVTWFQATAYCTWRDGRLPTEAEWEYAARGPDEWIFPWGNSFDGTRANHCDGNCGAASWASGFNYVNEENDDGYVVTAPVGSYPLGASWVGALDMSGNVWEWTSSLYQPYPYDGQEGREEFANRTDARVLRGSSYYSTSGNLRAADRGDGTPDSVNHGFGFRCVRSQ